MVVQGDAIVIVLDIGKNMHKDGRFPTALEDAKKCICMIIQRKIFLESKDHIALVLLGNEAASDFSNGDAIPEYENVSIVLTLCPPTWKHFEIVNDIEGTDVSTNLFTILGLETAVNLLQKSKDLKLFETRRILFFSNFDGYFPHPDINILFDEMKNSKIEISFIGPVAFPEDIKSEVWEDETKMIEKCHVSELLGEVNGESYSYSDVLPTLASYQVKKVQSYPTNLNLEIGSLTIPISVHIKVSETKSKTWGNACSHNLSQKPIRKTTYCMNDISQTEVSSEDLIQAFKYGTTLVPYSKDDKKNMDYQPGDKGMKLIGFTRAENIPRFLYTGDKSRYVFSQKNNESAGEALAAFIEVMKIKNKVAIVRYVATARSAPVMGFLLPRCEPNYECLVFITLPFLEDLRHFVFTPLDSDSRNVPTGDQLAAVDEFITAMDMTEFDEDEEEEEQDLFNPKNNANPYLQRLYQCLQHRLFHPEGPLPEIEPHVLAGINPLPKLLKRARTPLEKIKSLFPLKEYVPKKQPDSKSHLFTSSTSDKSIGNNSMEEGVAEAKFEITDTKLVDAITDKITQVGSVNPVRDIQFLINNHILTFKEICDQINDVLTNLLQESDHLRFNYSKILSICKEYRFSALKEGDCEKYNIFMIALRKQLLEIDEELWDKIRDEKITLISKDQLPSSTVSSEEAESFLSKPHLPGGTEMPIESPVPCDDDEDDLMDLL